MNMLEAQNTLVTIINPPVLTSNLCSDANRLKKDSSISPVRSDCV